MLLAKSLKSGAVSLQAKVQLNACYGYCIQHVVGHRSDLAAAAHSVLQGKRMRDIAKEDPVCYARFHRGLHALRHAVDEPSDDLKEVVVYLLTGPTGTGKSSWVRQHFRGAYVPPAGPKLWFDDYDGHTHVHLEEYRSDTAYEFGALLRILDHWESRLPVKCSFTTFRPQVICITSNQEPAEWYPALHPDAFQPFWRRISHHLRFPLATPPTPAELAILRAGDGLDVEAILAM